MTKFNTLRLEWQPVGVFGHVGRGLTTIELDIVFVYAFAKISFMLYASNWWFISSPFYVSDPSLQRILDMDGSWIRVFKALADILFVN